MRVIDVLLFSCFAVFVSVDRVYERRSLKCMNMVKSCCAVGCTNRYTKDCGLRFYRFPSDVDRRSKWLAAMKRDNWKPDEHSWVCSAHFVSGNKSDDPLSPDLCVPFPLVSQPKIIERETYILCLHYLSEIMIMSEKKWYRGVGRTFEVVWQ